jgi:hypothetical protein
MILAEEALAGTTLTEEALVGTILAGTILAEEALAETRTIQAGTLLAGTMLAGANSAGTALVGPGLVPTVPYLAVQSNASAACGRSEPFGLCARWSHIRDMALDLSDPTSAV